VTKDNAYSLIYMHELIFLIGLCRRQHTTFRLIL